MKKIWPILCLAALLALPLAGCGNKDDSTAGANSGAPTPSAAPSQSTATEAPSGDMDMDGDGNPGDDDLAGADGVVGGGNGEADGSGAGDGGVEGGLQDGGLNGGVTKGINSGIPENGEGMTQSRNTGSALDRVGDGVRNTLDDIGAAARQMGRDAKRAME